LDAGGGTFKSTSTTCPHRNNYTVFQTLHGWRVERATAVAAISTRSIPLPDVAADLQPVEVEATLLSCVCGLLAWLVIAAPLSLLATGRRGGPEGRSRLR